MAILTAIRLCGTMQGSIWWPAGQICETQFSKDFTAPKMSHSPWQEDWPGIDEALQAALASGDFQGGMADLVAGWLEFHITAPDGSRRSTICKALESLAAAQPYLAKEA